MIYQIISGKYCQRKNAGFQSIALSGKNMWITFHKLQMKESSKIIDKHRQTLTKRLIDNWIHDESMIDVVGDGKINKIWIKEKHFAWILFPTCIYESTKTSKF